MYTIEKKHYGLYVTMGGLYSPDEIKSYLRERKSPYHKLSHHFLLLLISEPLSRLKKMTQLC